MKTRQLKALIKALSQSGTGKVVASKQSSNRASKHAKEQASQQLTKQPSKQAIEQSSHQGHLLRRAQTIQGGAWKVYKASNVPNLPKLHFLALMIPMLPLMPNVASWAFLGAFWEPPGEPREKLQPGEGCHQQSAAGAHQRPEGQSPSGFLGYPSCCRPHLNQLENQLEEV